MTNNYIKNSYRIQGQAMLLTVILLSTAILGATALVGLLMTYQIRNSSDIEASSQAIFAADAGIECALYYGADEDDWDKCGTSDDPANPPIELGNGATYRVRFIEQSEILTFAQSVGQSGRTARAFQIPLPENISPAPGQGSGTLLDDLVSYWKFDEGSGTTATDSHGSNNGSLINSPSWTTESKLGDRAIEFDGNNDRINIISEELRDVHNTGEVSYAVWYMWDSGTGGRLMHRGSSSDGSGFSGCQYEPAIDTGLLNLSGCSGTGQVGSFDGSLVDGWNHLVVAFSESTDEAKIYLNGNLVVDESIADIKTASNRDSLIFNAESVADFIVLGASHNAGSYVSHFNNIMDEPAIWSRALTSDEVGELWNGGAGLSYDDF